MNFSFDCYDYLYIFMIISASKLIENYFLIKLKVVIHFAIELCETKNILLFNRINILIGCKHKWVMNLNLEFQEISKIIQIYSIKKNVFFINSDLR